MTKSPKSRSLTLFYILVAYVFLQLIWWAIHIIQLTSQLGEGDDYTTRRIWMIIGEGLVFFVLLAFGVYKIRKSFKEEVKLAQQKQNFALSISHELKSPIAAIKLYLQTLEKRELPEDKRVDILNKCIASTNRLDGLVSNILLSNVVDSNNYQLSAEKCHLKAQIEDLISIHQLTSPSAKIELKYIGNETIIIDKASITSILSNLIENGIKYSESPEEISILANVSETTIEISIADNGYGIPENEKELIFQKFYRTGDEITRKAKGAGLGLYIVSELVSLHNGTISIEKNSPKGSIFKLNIPLKK